MEFFHFYTYLFFLSWEKIGNIRRCLGFGHCAIEIVFHFMGVCELYKSVSKGNFTIYLSSEFLVSFFPFNHLKFFEGFILYYWFIFLKINIFLFSKWWTTICPIPVTPCSSRRCLLGTQTQTGLWTTAHSHFGEHSRGETPFGGPKLHIKMEHLRTR